MDIQMHFMIEPIDFLYTKIERGISIYNNKASLPLLSMSTVLFTARKL